MVSDRKERGAESRDQITVMLRQEESTYKCPDYLSSDWLAQQYSSSSTREIQIVEDIASIVTGYRLPENPVNESSHSSNNKIRKSPSSNAVTASLSSMRSSTPPIEEASWDQNIHLGPWRQQMCSWAYSAVDTFGLDREIVAIAFQLLDRYLAHESLSFATITREDFQLFSMTSLYIAVKMFKPTANFSIHVLLDMCQGFYSAKDILITEMDMLEALKWHVNPPTALAFARLFLDLSPLLKEESPLFFRHCRYLTEVALQDSYFLSKKPSCVAVAAILIAARYSVSVPQGAIDDFVAAIEPIVDISSVDVTTVYQSLESSFYCSTHSFPQEIQYR